MIFCANNVASTGLAGPNLGAWIGVITGDMLLKKSDLVIAVGYDPIEYEPRNWNAEGKSRIVVIDAMRGRRDLT
ncbi:hypothetical protein WP50_13050 [Lactiplantibacillus plantarum]|nr:hypothetical protein WP50_13050 [Lactiplantibacillus plantarum]